LPHLPASRDGVQVTVPGVTLHTGNPGQQVQPGMT
jgi:hypothetical protein